MTSRVSTHEQAILVHIFKSRHESKDLLVEFRELALAAGAKPVATVTGTRAIPEAKYFVSSGKAEEIFATRQATQTDLILFNHDLSPSQERNLAQLFSCRVVSRTGLILDIFAQRARSFEGKLQVELAQLQHLSTRLVRGWTHLERQVGGIGLRGPGEMQLETDRRLIRSQIKIIKKRLEKVKTQRVQNRRARCRSQLPIVAIIGYTNTGKSTLFNKLTRASVQTADQVFVTLDPTLRRIHLPNGQIAILVDTVGFIRQLPLQLIDAFRATLEETQTADLLIHVVDAHCRDKPECIKEVQSVLQQINAAQIPQLIVYNKIDLLPNTAPGLEYNADGLPRKVWLAANSGLGVELLQRALMELTVARKSFPA